MEGSQNLTHLHPISKTTQNVLVINELPPPPHYCHNRAFRKIIPLLKEHTPPFRASGYALPAGVF